jgi:glycosyltransferase involved in cell wall biosynthesis
MLLSLNRYERKKNIGLAIQALKEVIHRHAHSSGACAQCRLIVAGGYDPRVSENVQYFQEMQDLAQELDVQARVVFLRNVTDSQRCATDATTQWPELGAYEAVAALITVVKPFCACSRKWSIL